jgi:pilus assembly protein CpaD
MKRIDRTTADHCRRTAARLAVAAGIAVMLAGCYKSPQVAEPAYPTDYRERHPITLKERAHTVEVFVSRNRGGLTPMQRADVLSFAQQWRRESMSGIIIDVPRGGGLDHAVSDSMREVHSILAASGVPRNAVYLRNYRTQPTALASIKMNYSRLSADAGPCGQWPDDLGPSIDSKDFENRPYWNLGCATQRNLAAMVENPADLVQPRGETPAYSGRRSVAVDKYRKGDNPSGTYTGYEAGKISDVGK